MAENTDLWQIERDLTEQGIGIICGCDEAGAGPLAGPVYAAAVILPPYCRIEGLNDSKKLTEKKREALYEVITQKAVCWAVARVEAAEIDATDILSARMKAMQQAMDALTIQPEIALIDGNRDKGRSAAITTPHKLVVGGDGNYSAPSLHRGGRWEERLHRGRLHPGQGQPGPLCLHGAGPGVSPVPVCQTQGLRHQAAL